MNKLETGCKDKKDKLLLISSIINWKLLITNYFMANIIKEQLYLLKINFLI